jgi:hypothetical protein
MLTLSDSTTRNIYAIPGEKYIIQIEPSLDVEIMTYIGMGVFRRYPFGIDLGNLDLDYESQYFEIDLFNLDENPEIYIHQLDIVLKSKSVKDLLDKETYSNDVESYSLFMNAIKNEFNEEAKVPVRWIKNQKSDSIYDETGLKYLLEYQLESSKLDFAAELELEPKLVYSPEGALISKYVLPPELDLSPEDKELYISKTCRKLSQFQFQYMSYMS